MKAHLMTLLALALPALSTLAWTANVASAAPPSRPTAHLRTAQPGPPPLVEHEQIYDPAPVPEQHFDEGCCNDCPQDNCCRDFGRLTAGYAFVLLKPHREDDVALTRTRQDAALQSTTDQAFNQDMELSPRVWLEYSRPNGLGARVGYWQFDHGTDALLGTPSAAAVEVVQTPGFRGFLLSTQNPNEDLLVASSIETDVLDLEGVKWTDFCCWRLGATAGLRHASISQGYSAVLLNVDSEVSAFMNASHRFDGVGPTFSLEGRRAFGPLCFYSMARGSLLYGNGKLDFTGVVDVDSSVPLTTQVFLERNDVLTMAEIQIGLEWKRECCNGNLFFIRTAMEGQVWQGVGSALDEDGDLGFFGFNLALGLSL